MHYIDRNIVSSIPDNWLQHYNVPQFQMNSISGVCVCKKGYGTIILHLSITGANFWVAKTKLGREDFKCVYSKCPSVLKIYDVNVFSGLSLGGKKDLTCNVELVVPHDIDSCEFFAAQHRALFYMDMIRNYLKNPNNTLHSYVGFNTFPLDEEPSITVYDHFLTHVRRFGPYAFCKNDIQYDCIYPCIAKVSVRTRDIYTVKLCSEQGENSEKLSEYRFIIY